MFMVVTGSFNPYEIASVVEENLNEKEFLEYKNHMDFMNQEPKKDAKKYLQQAFPVLWLEDQMVYDKKKEYLKKKFGI